ncbi:hypothetical protein EDD15DRAFT_1708947 [Pisolithus albus]|nr:hypothetical protein EDD15DRAFT_1708947 [Pisolithus albus]
MRRIFTPLADSGAHLQMLTSHSGTFKSGTKSVSNKNHTTILAPLGPCSQSTLAPPTAHGNMAAMTRRFCRWMRTMNGLLAALLWFHLQPLSCHSHALDENFSHCGSRSSSLTPLCLSTWSLAISKISCRQTCLPSVSVCYPHFCCSSARLFPAPWNLVMWCHPIDLVSIGDHLTREKTPCAYAITHSTSDLCNSWSGRRLSLR